MGKSKKLLLIIVSFFAVIGFIGTISIATLFFTGNIDSSELINRSFFQPEIEITKRIERGKGSWYTYRLRNKSTASGYVLINNEPYYFAGRHVKQINVTWDELIIKSISKKEYEKNYQKNELR